MDHNFDTLRHVLANFRLEGIRSGNITRLKGGLSGSDVWQVESPWGSFCLKCMPEGFSVQRITAIHQAVTWRRDAGMKCLVGYCQATSGQTFVEHDGRIWELQMWAKGEEPLPPYTNWQKTGMFQAVARFHRILQDTPHDRSQLAKSEGVSVRLDMLRTWRKHRLQELDPRLASYEHPRRKELLSIILFAFQEYQHLLEPLLEEVGRHEYLVEQCIGDPRPENFRFENHQISALIDLGSMRRDNIALDISRLASEVSFQTPVDWQFTWDCIEVVRPLKEAEKHLAHVLDAANVVLTGLKWVQWLLLDGYSFQNEELVDARLHHLCYRLREIDQHPAWK